MKRMILIFGAALGLMACDKMSPSTPTYQLPHHDKAAEEAQLNKSGIDKASFQLLKDLNFQDAELERAPDELKANTSDAQKLYTFAFVNGQRVSVEQARHRGQYCEVSVVIESPQRIEEVKFAANARFVSSMWYPMSDELIGSLFTLVLKSTDQTALLLTCLEVLDLQTLKTQLGSLFLVEEAKGG